MFYGDNMGCFMGNILENIPSYPHKKSPFGKYFTPNNWEMCVHLMFIWNVRLDVITSP